MSPRGSHSGRLPGNISFSPLEKPRSMKHLTCFFWAQGHCKWEEDDCLYAHRQTGHVAGGPLRLERGRK